MPARKKKAATRKKPASRKATPAKPSRKATPAKPSRKRLKTQRQENAARRRAGEPELPMPKRAPIPHRDGEPSAGPQPMDHCPACDEFKLLTEFALGKDEKMPRTGAFVCRACRNEKRKPATDALMTVGPRDRQLFRDLIRTQSFAETARLHGISAHRVRELTVVKRKDDGVNAIARREAWRQLLIAEGLDAATLSRLMKLETYAVEPRWNSAKGEFDFFPDHKSRQSAIRWLAKQTGLDAPSAALQEQAPVPSVIIVNNLGDKATGGDTGTDRFTIDVTPKVTEPS
jgi:hypothetical protein